MWMWRSWSRMLCLAGGLLAVGCTDYGSFSVSWRFAPDESPSTGCGLHGVDSIRMTGMSAEGDGADVTTLCTTMQPGLPGDAAFSHSVPVGTWTFTVQQLDVRGRLITPTDTQGYPLPDPMATATVAADSDTPLDPAVIVLTPRPECGDGVDNDLDGRVDLDDPGCEGSMSAAAECRVGLDPECPGSLNTSAE
jgi:hypothetical protein